MKRKDRETRDRLLVENYIAQKTMGRKKNRIGSGRIFQPVSPLYLQTYSRPSKV